MTNFSSCESSPRTTLYAHLTMYVTVASLLVYQADLPTNCSCSSFPDALTTKPFTIPPSGGVQAIPAQKNITNR